MKNIPKSLALLLLLTIIWSVSIPRSASAATVINTPAGGECYKGGVTVPLSWTISGELFANHSHVAYSDTATFPGYNQTSNIPGGSNSDTESPLNWTLPLVTGSTFKIKVTSLSSLNTPNSSAESNTFSIDSSTPSAPALIAKVVSSKSVQLNWTASTDPGCMPLSGYKIFRDNQLIGMTTSLSYIDQNRTQGKLYTYHVQAFDGFDANDSQAVTVALPAAVATTIRPATPVAPAEAGTVSGGEVTTGIQEPQKTKPSKGSAATQPEPTIDQGKNQNYTLPVLMILAGLGLLALAIYRYNPALLLAVRSKVQPFMLAAFMKIRTNKFIKESKQLARTTRNRIAPIVAKPTKPLPKSPPTKRKVSRAKKARHSK